MESAHLNRKPKTKARSDLGLTLTAKTLTNGEWLVWISRRVTGCPGVARGQAGVARKWQVGSFAVSEEAGRFSRSSTANLWDTVANMWCKRLLTAREDDSTDG